VKSETRKVCSLNALPIRVKIKCKTIILPVILNECKIWPLTLNEVTQTQGEQEKAGENFGNKRAGRDKRLERN
jgi:hypothetical protein